MGCRFGRYSVYAMKICLLGRMDFPQAFFLSGHRKSSRHQSFESSAEVADDFESISLVGGGSVRSHSPIIIICL